MKFKLEAGAEVDILSPSEMSKEVDRLEKVLSALHRDDPTTIQIGDAVATDAAGNLGGGAGGPGVMLYRAPVGTFATVHRLCFSTPFGAAGSPGGAPVAAGNLAIYFAGITGENLVTFLPQGANPNVLPAVFTWTGDAPVVNSGQGLFAIGTALPVSTMIAWGAQLALWPKTAASRERIPTIPAALIG